MKKYMEPQLDVQRFDVEDVITASGTLDENEGNSKSNYGIETVNLPF